MPDACKHAFRDYQIAFEMWHDQWTRVRLGFSTMPTLIANMYVEKAYTDMKQQEAFYKACMESVKKETNENNG